MSRRILLADDSVTIQKVIELTFMDDDYEVRAVGNGDEAIAMLSALQVDFVIADVHMPGASGYEVCRRSKQLRPEVPVLLLVGTFEPFDEAQARECGAESFLKKPFDSQELLGRVHDLLGGTAGAAASSAAAQPAAVPAAPPGHPAVTAAPGGDDARPLPAPAASPGGAQGAGQASAVPSPPLPPTSAAGAAGAPAGVRGTGVIEAAASWQEFELEAEPEFIPDPWNRDLPPPSAAATAAAPPAARPDAHPFALGDLEEQEAAEMPAAPSLAGLAPASPAGEGTPAAPERSTAAGTASGAAATAETIAAPVPLGFEPALGQPFTLGEPLDDHAFLLDDSDEERSERSERSERPHDAVPPPAAETPGWHVAPGSVATLDSLGTLAAVGTLGAVGSDALRATHAEPVSPFPAQPPNPAQIQPDRIEVAPAHAAAGGTSAAGSEAPPPTPPDAAPSPAGTSALGDGDIDRIARRVVELLGDKVVRDVAWEVIPDLAEVVIKDRLRELESQLD